MVRNDLPDLRVQAVRDDAVLVERFRQDQLSVSTRNEHDQEREAGWVLFREKRRQSVGLLYMSLYPGRPEPSPWAASKS